MSLARLARGLLAIASLSVLLGSAVQIRSASAERPRIILAACEVKNFKETQAKFLGCMQVCSNRHRACLDDNRRHGRHSDCRGPSDQCGLDCQATFHPWVTAEQRLHGCR